MVFKRKQVVILSLVLMIIVAGYLQYSYKKSSTSTADKEPGKLGEAVFVDSNDSASADQENKEAKAEPKGDSKASKNANDYFTQAKMEKEITRSKTQDSLKEITKDANASQDAKDSAYSQMQQILANVEKEMKIETLVKDKGFADAIALIGEDESVDVVVMAPSLTTADIAQISDIVSRQAKVDMGSIHISNKY